MEHAARGDKQRSRDRRRSRARARRAGLTAAALALFLLAAPSARAQPKPARAPAIPAPNATLPARPGQKPDLAFGAFQRGYFLTAFRYATDDAAAGNAKAMTLLGELYANGLGVPRDDKKAADWYRLAAARGDRNAIFALR